MVLAVEENARPSGCCVCNNNNNRNSIAPYGRNFRGADVLEQIKVNSKVISRRNLDTVRNIDKFCQFGHTYASNLTATFSLVEDRTTVDRHVYRCILCA